VTAADQPWVDPEVPAAGAALRERGLSAPPLGQAPLADVRGGFGRIAAFLSEGSQPLRDESQVEVPGPHGPIACRIYRPDGATGVVPALVYFHGGGFALGEAAYWDAMLRDLVRQSGVAAVNVDYRLSPEHRFPVQFDEAVAAIRHFAAGGGAHGIDGTRLAAGGDSAGANLALAAACALRDAGHSPLKALLLYYGVYTPDTAAASWQRLGSGAFGLSLDQMEWIWSHYLPEGGNRTDWRAAPGLAAMAGLPQALVHAATLDPLLDDSHALVRKL
jgi:acetyl esterase